MNPSRTAYFENLGRNEHEVPVGLDRRHRGIGDWREGNDGRFNSPGRVAGLNLPAPDVVKILREGLPKLPVKLKFEGKTLAPPPEILEELKLGVTLRNTVTHAGRGRVSRDKVHSILCAVRDVLSLVDYYRGNEWALCRVSPETRQSLLEASSADIEQKIKVEDAAQPGTAMSLIQLSDLPPRIS